MEEEKMMASILSRVSIEEFLQIQQWMELAEKDSELYKSMKQRYICLKAFLTGEGVNLTELDTIKE